MKLLYLAHIDWHWIFQRPQIIELLLEEDFDCTVVNRSFIGRKQSKANNKLPSKLINVYQLPRENKYPFIKKINKMLINYAIKDWNAYDIIWICYPLLYDLIPNLYKGRIIYDCMDSYVTMAKESMKQEVFESEQNLIKRADLVFSSSLNLIHNVKNLEKKAILVRNGFISQKNQKLSTAQIKEEYNLGYFGTISEWFDFNLLNESINQFNNIKYHLYGPIENKVENIISNLNGRIIFEGVINHSDLYNKIKDYDALIMPFQLNETVLAVDPVKLYEYICFGKCIISIYYPEIERFRPFVYFYNNVDEYIELIRELCEKGFPPKYTKQQQEEFLKENTWEKRYEVIKEKLNEL